MMVVGICGSPKKAGNTEFLLSEALAVAGERGFDTQRLLISEMKVDFCNDCGDCSKGKSCPKEDDTTAILSSLERADGIIIASPVYFGSVTAQLKAVFDRTIPLRRQGFRLKDKVGCAISVGGSRNGGQEKTLETVHAWMHIHGMIVVGDDPTSEALPCGLQRKTASAERRLWPAPTSCAICWRGWRRKRAAGAEIETKISG